MHLILAAGEIEFFLLSGFHSSSQFNKEQKTEIFSSDPTLYRMGERKFATLTTPSLPFAKLPSTKALLSIWNLQLMVSITKAATALVTAAGSHCFLDLGHDHLTRNILTAYDVRRRII